MVPDKLTYPAGVPESIKSVLIVDLRKSLPVNPKYTWEVLKGPRDVAQLTTIVMHHDAMAKLKTSAFNDRELASRIATSHIDSKKNIPGGDAGFPYHLWVRNGIVYLCNNFEAFTYGVKENNSYTVHICVSGDYANSDSLTEQDRTALYAAYFFAKQFMPQYQKSVGHKELMPTDCPGYNMDKVRKDIATFELDMTLNSSPNTVLSRIFAFHTRYLDLYNKAIKETDPNKDAARYKLNQLIDEAVAAGIYTPQQ